jgi:type I restriction-modification system DNA methylase subunit/restriction endonuclease S subunit
MGRSTVHYANNETNNILKRLHNKLRPAGTPVERVEYIIELLLLRIFEAKLKQDETFKPLRKLFEGENYRLLFSYIYSISNGDRILSELNKTIFPFYASILHEVRKVVKGNLPQKMQDQLVLMEEVFANSNFTNNVKGGVITEVIGLVNEIDEKYILKTDLLGDAIESALSETGGTKDLGLYRTPDHIRRMMVAMIDPDFTDTIFDPACGTAGFLFDAYDYVIDKSNRTEVYPSDDVAKMFYRTGIGGIEYQGRIRKMAAVNMYIRGLNPHNIEQGDSLKMFDPAHDTASKSVVIANPPFGAERDQPAYPNVWEEYSKESETTILFVKLMYDLLKTGGRCAVVVSEGFLTWGQGSACALRKMLLENANLRAIVSLPQGVFVSKSGQGAKTSILYFEKGQPTDFVWYYKIQNDGFSMGSNRKPIEGSQIPELLTLFDKVRKGERPADTAHSFCINHQQIETLDPRIEKRIKREVTESMSVKNAAKREKKIAELDKKLAAEKISKVAYEEELLQFDDNLEAQIENEIAKAIEKAHTYHFNLQNYRSNLTADQQSKILQLLPDKGVNPADALHIDLLREHLNQNADNLTPELRQVEEILRQGQKYPIVSLKELITVNTDKIKPSAFPNTEFTVLGVSKQTGVFVNELLGENIKQSYFRVKKYQFCYNPYRINVGSIGFCELEIENQIISGAYNIFGCNENRLNPKYLDALFHTPKFLNYVNERAIGGVRMDFKIEYMQEWQIPLPSLEIQNEIVEKIEKQKEIIAGAEKMEENIVFQIPQVENSTKKLLKEIAVIKSGGTPSRTEPTYWNPYEVPWVKTGEINYNEIYDTEEKISKNGVENSSAKIIKANTLLMAMYGQGVTRGRVAILRIDAAINQACAAFTNLEKEIDLKYLYYYLYSKYDEIRASSFGTNQENLNAKIIENITIEYPLLSIQHEIVERLDRQMSALEGVRYLKTEAERRIEEILAGVWGEKSLPESQKEQVQEAKVIALKPDNKPEDKPFLKRKILATYIINQSLNDLHFGDVKFEKLFYLSEYFAIKRNFEQKYYVQAAGPYDNVFTREYFKQVEQSKWFNRQRKGNQYIFSKGEKHDKSLNTYSMFSGNELEQVNTLINYFKKSDYEQPEIIATLYAVWNNRIIKQEPITDEFLKEDFLIWDAQKIKYKNRLDGALKWMREKGIVPDGWGEVIERVKTKTKKK